MDVLRAIFDARIRAGLTQAELSERSGISQADISRLEQCTITTTEAAFGRPSLLNVQLLEIDVFDLRSYKFQVYAAVRVVVGAYQILALYDADTLKLFKLPPVSAAVFLAVKPEMLMIDQHAVSARADEVWRKQVPVYPYRLIVVMRYHRSVIFPEY